MRQSIVNFRCIYFECVQTFGMTTPFSWQTTHKYAHRNNIWRMEVCGAVLYLLNRSDPIRPKISWVYVIHANSQNGTQHSRPSPIGMFHLLTRWRQRMTLYRYPCEHPPLSPTHTHTYARIPAYIHIIAYAMPQQQSHQTNIWKCSAHKLETKLMDKSQIQMRNLYTLHVMLMYYCRWIVTC